MNLRAMRYLTAKTAKAMITIRDSPPAAAAPPIKAVCWLFPVSTTKKEKNKLRLVDKSKTNMKEKEKNYKAFLIRWPAAMHIPTYPSPSQTLALNSHLR